jgi:PKD repeat protein
MKRIQYTLLFLFSFSLLFSQSSFKGIPVEETSPAFDIQFSKYQLVELNIEAIYQYVKQRSSESRFRIRVGNTHDWDIGITPYDIRRQDYQVVVQSERGRSTMPRSENKTYRGQSYPQGGNVRMTIDQDFLYGFITEGDQVYYIEPAWPYDASLNRSYYLVYAESDVLDLGHTCGTDHHHNAEEKIPTAPEAARMMMNCYQVPVALAADFSIFDIYGSTTNTENFMVGVLNNVQTNYDDEFNDQIEFEVAGFFISTCSSCDPWTSSNNAGTLLNSFTNWGNSGGFGFSFSLASLWTNRNFSGSTIGVAWVGGLCSNLKYNTVQRFSTNASLLRVLQAHEFGHNFNAQHDAGGTPFIMAPSVNTSTQWSTTSQNTINSFVSFKANQSGCFFTCASSGPPEAMIVAPVTHVCPGSVVPFIDASLNNPTSWQWDFAGGQPSASTLQNPLVIYPNEGLFTVVLSVDNAQGSDLTVLDTDILVDQDGTKYLLYETFENGLGFWTTLNPDNSTTWQVTQVGGTQYGSRAAFVNNYDYDAEGQIDALISPTLDFSAESDLTFQMDYAYRRYNSSFSDQLRISISTNGGTTYPDELFFGQETGGGNFATSFDQTSSFTPSSPTDWCYSGAFGPGCITLDLSDYAGESNVKIKIENINDFGNNMYVDNIRITGNCQPTVPPIASFISDVTDGCAPLTVQYEDISFGTVSNWEWSFPGGTPSTSFDPNPTVVYTQPGVYDVSLTVYNTAGSDILSLPAYVIVDGPPVPDFLVDVEGFTATFTDLSIGANDSNWNFGDGATSTDPNPSHIYDEAGDYTVTLLVSNDCGTDSLSQTITIESPIEAGFDADTLHGCPGLVVSYMDTTIGNIISWEWIFEGGNPATDNVQNPTVSYDTSGLFSTTLIATNDLGDTDTLTQTDYIQIDELAQAGFTYQYTLGDTSVIFDNTSQFTDTYYWDFGDGDTSTVVNPTTTYSTDGEYSVLLIASNECGSDTITQIISIVTPPVADFNLDETSGCAPLTISPVDISSTNVDSLIWLAPGAMPDTSFSHTPTFTYSTEGNYTLSLIVVNEAGSDTLSTQITIGDSPTAAFSINYTIGNTSADFTSESTNANTYEWWFGDGDTSTEENPAHPYTADGLYTITHIAFNDCGSDTITNVLEVITAPTAAFNADNTEGCIPFIVNPIDASSSNTDTWQWEAPGATPALSSDQAPSFSYQDEGNYTITLITSNEAGSDTATIDIIVNDSPTAAFNSNYNIGDFDASFTTQSTNANAYEWWFGDGDTSTDENPTHTYMADGMYTVTHIAMNECGNDTTSAVLEIITLPTAAFSLNAAEGCTPFIASPVDASSSNTDSWQWTAPGATPEMSSDQAPQFDYDTPGTYTISLITTNEAGSDTSSLDITLGEGPQAGFSIDYTLGSNAASFNNQSTNANTYEWWFGDGDTSTDENPSHTYDEDETYTVTLISFNDCGSDTITLDVEIITPPVASFDIDTNEGCTPFTVNPTDASSENTEEWLWMAPGADPEMSDSDTPNFTYNTAGQYTLTLITTNEAGSDTSSVDITLGEGPQADFAIDYQVGTTVVSFSNQSSGANSYEWHFGDGNTSTDESPTHNYLEDDTYTITLIALNDCGPDTSIAEVKVVTAPTAAFGLDAVEGCAPFTVNPVDASSDNTDDWYWTAPGAMPEMADGNSPSFTYEMPGDYVISLITENQAGSDTTMMMLTVGTNPQAAFDIDYTIGSTTASFTAQSTTANAYEWSFGDGNFSTEQNPSNTYAEDGIYTVIFIAFNECGPDTIIQQLEIITAPTAAFQLDNTTACVPFTINPVDISSSNTDTWEWTAPGATPETAQGDSPSFTYEQEGTYTLTLTTSNEAGSDSFSMDITVNGTPTSAFDFQLNGVDIVFTNNSTDADSYSWDFGDNNSSTAENPSHTYDALGTYTITLSSTNECGTTTTTDSVTISMDMPIASFSAENNIGCSPLEVTFLNSSTNALTYEWTFEGGTPATSTEENPSVIFEEAGVYSVTLLVTNLAGSGALTQMDLVVVTPTPSSGFTYVVNGATVDFTNEAQDATEYLWLFGDGETSDQEHPTHTYTSGTSYPVSLIAINACGVDTFTQEVMISGSAPTPIFASSDTIGCAPVVVSFFGNTTGVAADSYEWVFEGGTPSSSTDQNPEVLYEETGTYTVSLTTTNGFGSETIAEVDYITIYASPTANFFYEYNSAVEVSFNSTVTGGGDLTYDWNFGDGNSSDLADPVHTYAEDGVYEVILTVSNECGQVIISDNVEIVINTTIDESWLEQLTVFPNPNDGLFTLEIAGSASPNIQARLINIVGQSIYSIEDQFGSGYWRHNFQLSNLPAGVYVLEVSTETRKAYRRVVIE